MRFCGGKSIRVKDLLKKFESDVANATEDDYLKVVNVLALYVFALGYDTRRQVESFVWVLVDNLREWDRFPWGAYIYPTLLNYMSLLPNTRLECGSKYHFIGPVWALQIWACEAIPDLAGQIAQCIYPHPLPRCLRWFLVQSSIDDFDAFFKAGVEPNEE
ncbi:hypothetical protein C2S52_014831 [Perilla frutescens var. hirtella]|nr:hypothetical protein C2S52_014831 [Perilla frutescens var. hirtella]